MAPTHTRRARAARRRQRRKDLPGNDLTDQQWAAICDAWGGCAYCGESTQSLQRDCVLPLSRGGRYTFDNVVAACRSCNMSKSNEEVTRWMRRRNLDEGEFLVRFYQIVRSVG